MMRKDEKLSQATTSPNPPRAHPTRREVLALGIGAFVVAAIPFARRRPLTLVRRRVPVMGSIAELAVAHREPAWANGAIDAAVDALRQVEQTMTRFDDASDVGRANLDAATRAIPISDATAEVLEEALWWAEASDGAFDPGLARASALWDPARRTAPPPGDAVARLAGRGLYLRVELGRDARGRHVVAYGDADLGLDLGAIAKGYGVDRAAAALRDWGIRHALVSAGGDLYALGRSPDGEPWRVGVRSPDRPDALAATLDAEDTAIATSGDYEQFFEHDGERYHHLLDPRSAAPRRTAQRSVTVAAASCMAADAGATAVFGMDPDAAGRLLARRGGGWIAHAV